MDWLNSSVCLAYGSEMDWSCPREGLELSLAERWERLDFDRDHWRSVIERARRSDDPAGVFQRMGEVDFRDPPEGTSWLRWAEWVDERLTEAAERPETVLRGVIDRFAIHSWRRRSSVVPVGAEAVLDRLGGPRWPAHDPSGGEAPVRWYVTGDTGAPVGAALRLDERGRPTSSTPTTWAGAVLQRTAGGTACLVGVHALEPDADPRAPRWRERWPALHALLGGWFSEAAFSRRDLWMQQRQMLSTEPAGVLARAVEEGGDLLTLGDADLRAAVLALGCIVELPHLRSWLQWMFWRVHRFDWT